MGKSLLLSDFLLVFGEYGTGGSILGFTHARLALSQSCTVELVGLVWIVERKWEMVSYVGSEVFKELHGYTCGCVIPSGQAQDSLGGTFWKVVWPLSGYFWIPQAVRGPGASAAL